MPKPRKFHCPERYSWHVIVTGPSRNGAMIVHPDGQAYPLHQTWRTAKRQYPWLREDLTYRKMTVPVGL